MPGLTPTLRVHLRWRLPGFSAEDGDMLRLAEGIEIDEREVKLVFVRSSGPGGQNVNKVATAVQLRFNVAASPSLPPEVKGRLIRLAGARMTAQGVLVIQASRHRTQRQNRADALARLAELIARALRPPRPRHPTSPTPASRRRRVEAKQRRAQIKRLRRAHEQ